MSSTGAGPHIRAAARAGQGEESEPLNPPPAATQDPFPDPKPLRDRRFDDALRERIPWASIALALLLLFLGTSCFVVAFLIHQGHTAGQDGQAVSFCLVGVITLLPGYFESRNAYYSWRKAKGYKFSQIPRY